MVFITYLHVEKSVYEKISISEVTELLRNGDVCALKFSKNDSVD